MREKYMRQLKLLSELLTEMGQMVEKAIEMAIRALVSQDEELAKEAIRYDEEIDDKEKEIQSLCLKLLLCQQPVAKDLRFISAALKMITDLERIGDQAADISELAVELKDKYTIIMVTHNMQQAARISDTTVFFLLGEIIEAGQTDVIFNKPADKRTEDYITGRFG